MIRDSARAGVTLLEVITVIVLFSLLLGLAIVFFRNSNRDLGVRASANQVVALLRAARDHARARHSPAWVVIDGGANAAYALTQETVGEWHFEDAVTTGAFGRDGRVSRGRWVQGRVGQGLEMTGSTTVECGPIPVYHPNQGFAVEFWYYRRTSPRAQEVFSIGRRIGMTVRPSGRIDVRLGSGSVTSGPILLRTPEVWYHIRMVFDGSEAQLFVNGARVGTGRGEIAWEEAPLVIGAGRQGGIRGILDEFRIALVFPGEKYALPRETTFEMPRGANQKIIRIYFDSQGRLDRGKHSGPVRVKIKSPADEKEIVVNMTGTIRR